ncbi:MAG: potassium channel beta subunit family protein [Gaiella sp.]
MDYRRLGRSGLQVSELSFGSWVTFGGQVDDDTALACLETARDAGVNFFDNAEAYASGGSERVMGRLFKRLGWRRSDIVVSTKIFWGGRGPNDSGLSRKHLLEGTAASLERLQLEHVDLLFCHRPDPNTPIEETVRGMSHLVNTGKTHYWGTSEWSAAEIQEAYEIARREHLVPPTMEQPEYNLFHRERVEREFAPLYESLGLGTTIWSPLAGGLLTGKYDDGLPDGARATIAGYGWFKERITSADGQKLVEQTKALKPIADSLGCTRAQLGVAWCLLNPNVSTVILGASRVEQLEENLGASDVVPKLTPEVVAQIDAVLGG